MGGSKKLRNQQRRNEFKTQHGLANKENEGMFSELEMRGMLIQTILTSAKSGTRFRKIVNDNDTIEYVIENLGDCGGYDEGSGSLVPSAQDENSMSVVPYDTRGRSRLDNRALVPHLANSLGSVIPQSIHITVKKQPEISGFDRNLRRSNQDKVRKDKTILKEGVGQGKIDNQNVYGNVAPKMSSRSLTLSSASSFPRPIQHHLSALQTQAMPTRSLYQNKIETDHFYDTDSDEDLNHGLKSSTKLPEILNKSLFVDSDIDSDEGYDLTSKTKQNKLSPHYSIEKRDALKESSTYVDISNDIPDSSLEYLDCKTALDSETALESETALTDEADKSLAVYQKKEAVCWCEACDEDATEQTNCFHCGRLSYCMLSCKRCAYVKYCSETCRAADLETHDKTCERYVYFTQKKNEFLRNPMSAGSNCLIAQFNLVPSTVEHAKGTGVGLLAEIIQVVQHTKFYLLTLQDVKGDTAHFIMDTSEGQSAANLASWGYTLDWTSGIRPGNFLLMPQCYWKQSSDGSKYLMSPLCPLVIFF